MQEYYGIVSFTEEAMVSSDFDGCPDSCIFDYKASTFLSDKSDFVKVS